MGRRFGNLTVTKLAGKNSSKHTLWECVCECGKTSIHTGNNLRCGHSKSCGHLRNRPTYVDLAGKKFGRLTVSGLKNTKGGISRWRCVCRCGNKVTVTTGHLKSKHTRSCGCLSSEVSRKLAYKHLAGKKKIQPNGSLPKRTLKGGYILVHDREHHRSNQQGFVLEHIVTMEKVLGRKLKNKETVHHLNGVRSDNREENLELWSHSHPCGQRIPDKVRWAKEILKLYDHKEGETING